MTAVRTCTAGGQRRTIMMTHNQCRGPYSQSRIQGHCSKTAVAALQAMQLQPTIKTIALHIVNHNSLAITIKLQRSLQLSKQCSYERAHIALPTLYVPPEDGEAPPHCNSGPLNQTRVNCIGCPRQKGPATMPKGPFTGIQMQMREGCTTPIRILQSQSPRAPKAN
jgi:hypothetical protein